MTSPRPTKGRSEGQWALGYREPLNPNEQFKKDDDALNVRDRIINHIPRHRRRQDPQRDPVRQHAAASHAASLRHEPRSSPGPAPAAPQPSRKP